MKATTDNADVLRAPQRALECGVSTPLSRNGQRPAALSDLTPPQLAEAAHGLDRLMAEYDNLSGICATLKGGVLREAKRRLGHGNYRPWLKANFPRSFKT